MYNTSTAESDEYNTILSYLERVGLPWNSWLTWNIHDAFNGCAKYYHILVCRRDNAIHGVASLAWKSIDNPSDGFMVYLDASDENALLSLLEEFPEAEDRTIRVFNPDLQRYLGSMSNVNNWSGELYYTLDRTTFIPVDGPDVVEVIFEGRHVYEGFEQKIFWEGMGEGKRYAILLDEKAVTTVGVGPIGPVMPSGKRAYAISGFYTQTAHRRKGYGRRLISYVTEMILNNNHVPMYWTETTNIASQNLCMSLGYQQYAQEMRYSF